MENDKIKPETANEREERILKFWQDNKIFEQSLAKESPAGEFVFYDGPPFATGLPHYGHLLPTTIKDVIPRYKTMKGYHVERKWGWDCHGLPVENLIEGELGLKTKKDIEALGVDKFNEAAKNSVLRYAADWKRIIPRVGRWVDMENDYRTMDWTYTETIWWIFKTLYDKNLIYEGYKSMHLCPRCETTLSNFEVNQGYKDITDLSLTAKFELIDQPGTFVLAWTTTPWTLPGNVALAVNSEVVYVKIKIADSFYILAKERLSAVKEAYEIIEEFLGSNLIGKKYKPLYDYYAKDEDLKNRENGWKIYGADFVTTVDGTGVVHIAPAFGEDDMNLGTQEKLPFIQHVGTNGQMKPEVVDFAGLSVKPKDDPLNPPGQDHQSTDILVIRNLAHRELLFSKEKIIHSYPHCWRCDTPLLNYASSSWFVKVTEFKSRLVANNQKTNWVPENIRDGRFGNWLEGARDWAISRARYWGAPLPVWRCDDCKEIEVLGSVEDLKKKANRKNKFFIMRHGEAQSVVGGFIDCSPDSTNSLTEKGRAEVVVSAESLVGKRIDLVFSSSFLRTRQTAEIVAEKIGFDKNKIVYDKRLWEINAGDFDGHPISEHQAFYTSHEDRFTKRAPNGENSMEIKARMMEFLEEVNSKYEGKNILMISHGDPLWLMIAGVQGSTPREAVDLRDDVYMSPAEVKELFFQNFPHNKNYELDLHKPYIDDVVFRCECGSDYKRVPEVFDCWFESGSMPYAQVHYPFENKEKFEANFPAQFIAEGLDQTRGWFYSLMVLSTALFNKPAFMNVIVNGLMLAEDGQKMSKRLKNYPDLIYMVEKYGADALRYYLVSSQAVRADDVRLSEKGVDEVYKKLILRLQNVVSFYELYYIEGSTFDKTKVSDTFVLDVWIKARLSSLAEDVEKHLKDYELDRASRPIMDFVDDLSTWYLRRSRDRLKSDDLLERNSALMTIRFVLLELSKIMAPFTPFIADDVYQRVTGNCMDSVHLQAWPFFGEVVDDKTAEKEKIFAEMKAVRDIVSLALDERKKLGIPVRQPLQKLKIKNGLFNQEELKNRQELLQLIQDEVNIKEVMFDDKLESEIKLDTNITPELKDEGNLRDLTRHLQDTRKKMGLQPDQKITLIFSGEDAERKFIEKFSPDLKKIVGATTIKESENGGEEMKIADMVLRITLSI